MKESKTSLRLYFGLLAILTVLSGDLWYALAGTPSLIDIASIVQILGYVYFAVTLPKYLNQERVKYVKGWLLIVFALSVIITFINGPETGGYIGLAIAGLLTWYLYNSVSRLSKSN